jgi:vitamin B12 transporter
MKGVESNIKFKFAPQYSIDINYTFLETKNINSNSIDNGQPLLYRPKHKASLLLNAAPVQSLNVNIEALYIGTRYNAVWGFTKTYVQLPDHYLVNAAINYRYDTNFLCYARIENLFDRKYEEISGYGTPRFSVYFGIRYELGNEK